MGLSEKQRISKGGPWIVAALTLLFFSAYVGVFVRGHSGKLTYLVHAGSMLCDPTQVPANLYIHPNTTGYDGQAFYRLALTPFTHRQIDHGMKLDAPSYRQQRIALPLMAYVLSFGNPLWVGKALVLINLLSLAGLGYAGALFARDKGQSAVWSLLLVLSPSWLVVVLYDTAEITSTLFLLIGLLFIDRKRFGWAAFWLTIAMLTRETSLIGSCSGLAALGLVVLQQRTLRAESNDSLTAIDWRPLFLLITVPVYLSWTAYLTHVWGSSPASISGGRLGLPFKGILQAITHGTLPYHQSYDPKTILHMLYILAETALGGWALRASRAPNATKICWIVFALMTISFAYPMIYFYDVDYFRVLSEFFAFTAVILITSPSRLKAGALAATAAIDISFVLDYFHRTWG